MATPPVPTRRPRPLHVALSLGVLAILIMGLNPAAQSARPAPDQQYPRTSKPVEAPPDSTLEAVRERGVLRWGADAAGGAPFTFYDPSDPSKIIGFEFDIMQRVAAKMGVRLEQVQADWLALYDMLKSGRCDMLMNGFEVTEDRQEQADFSNPYYRYGEQLTVRVEDAAKYKTLAGLKGKAITVLNGSAAVDLLLEEGWSDSLIKQYDDNLTPYTEVALGRAEGSIAESIIAAYYAAKDARLVNQPELFAFGEYAAVVRKGDSELLAEINAILAEMMASGELGEIYQRWGIWNDTQSELNIAMGSPQEVIAAARSPDELAADGADAAAHESDWPRIWRAIGKGVLFTILLTVISMPVAVIFGLFLALGSMSKRWWLKWPSLLYIIIVRGTPLLVQVYLIYYSLPALGEWLHGLAPGFFNALGLSQRMLTWPNLLVGILCLAGNYAAYEAEIHRAGLQAVPKGQRDAAASLGMTNWQAFRHVIFPQSFRIVLPPIVNDLNSMIKDSCLVSVIGVPELLQSALGIGKAKFIVPKMMAIAAAVYLVLCAISDWFGRWLERKLKQSSVRTANNNNGAAKATPHGH
jgi:polar amino acid transport system substrate-binding protein